MFTQSTQFNLLYNSGVLLYLFQQDRRYLVLDDADDERDRILYQYIGELSRRGPPPPPTASTPANRSKRPWFAQDNLASKIS
jgi:hypothetical protein